MTVASTSFSPAIEIIGVSGAGKSTICRALPAQVDGLHDGLRLAVRGYPHRFAGCWVGSRVAAMAEAIGMSPQLWLDLKDRIYLDTFRRIAANEVATDGPGILFDQGPLYRLARLWPGEGGGRAAKAWTAAVLHWSSILELVVLLDAPDDLLLERIGSRRKKHRIEGQQAHAAGQFLDDFRRRFDAVLSTLCQHGGPPVLSFDTSTADETDVLHSIVAAWCQRSHHDPPGQPNTTAA